MSLINLTINGKAVAVEEGTNILEAAKKVNIKIWYCVLGEFWKEADGDQLLLRPGEETIWYYAHEQDKVKRLCNDMTELLEKKLARYLNEQ